METSDYDRRLVASKTVQASGSNDKAMIRLVTVIDKMLEGVKYHRMAEKLAMDVLNLVSQDPRFKSDDVGRLSDYVYGTKGDVEGLIKAIKQLDAASKGVGYYYDELNKRMLRYKNM